MTERRSTGNTQVMAAIDNMRPWQRVVMFLMGIAIFAVPVIGHLGPMFGLPAHEEGVVTLSLDGLFLFFGLLLMMPKLGIKVANLFLVWRKK